MKILLTGANGNIGQYLYPKLETNYSITACSRTKYSEESNIIAIDFLNLNDIQKILDTGPFDILIFLVGQAHKKVKDANIFEEKNYKTLKNLLSVLRGKKALPDKIIFFSTISVYGESLNIEKYTEEIETNPISYYAVTKKKAEDHLLKEFGNHWIIRLAPVYSDTFRLNINKRIKFGKIFFKVGDGNKKLSLCNMRNIYELISGIINDTIDSGVYNLSDAQNYSFNDLLENQSVKYYVRIPNVFISLVYKFGSLINNVALKENAIKLLTDNIYPSDKIQKYLYLPYKISS